MTPVESSALRDRPDVPQRPFISEVPMNLSASPGTVEEILPSAVPDGTRPLLTFYDDATGERTELSAAALGSWAAKTANLLLDGCGLRAGDRAAVLLPAHWQTAAVLGALLTDVRPGIKKLI
jgi:acyl-CoA synthetase (AMP-forming)/AMP-acid ligase II